MSLPDASRADAARGKTEPSWSSMVGERYPFGVATDGAVTGRELPDKPAGTRGVKDWFLGRTEYAHPALRWASMPLFRLAWIAFFINVVQDFKDTAASAVFVALCAVSFMADAINWFLMRRRRARRAAT